MDRLIRITQAASKRISTEVTGTGRPSRHAGNDIPVPEGLGTADLNFSFHFELIQIVDQTAVGDHPVSLIDSSAAQHNTDMPRKAKSKRELDALQKTFDDYIESSRELEEALDEEIATLRECRRPLIVFPRTCASNVGTCSDCIL